MMHIIASREDQECIINACLLRPPQLIFFPGATSLPLAGMGCYGRGRSSNHDPVTSSGRTRISEIVSMKPSRLANNN